MKPLEPSTPTPVARGQRVRWPLLLLPLAASAFTRGLWAPDEPRYAEVAREIVEGGDWIVMHLCGGLYPDKPPLLFWIAGLLGRLSDWNEGVMRLVSLAAMAGTAWLVARLAARWWGRLEAELAPAIFLGLGMVAEIGGRLQIDPLLCLLVTSAIVAATEQPDDPRRRIRNVLLAGLCVGLGVLAKGPVSYVAVGLPLLAWRFLGGRSTVATVARVPSRAVVGAILLAVLLPLAWVVAALLREPLLVDQLVFEQHIGKALDGSRHPAPFWQYLARTPALLLPWTVPVVVGLVGAWHSFRARRRQEPADEGLLWAGAWFLVLFVFFSLLVSKRDLYLLPAYPAAALLASRAVTRCASHDRFARGAGWFAVGLVGLVALALAVAATAPFWLDAAHEYAGEGWRVLLACLGWCVGLVFLLRAVRARDVLGWCRALLRTWALAGALLVLLVFPVVDRHKSGESLARRIAARPEQPTTIPTLGVHPEAYRFYGGVPTVRDNDLEAALLRDGDDMLGLVRRRKWDRDIDADLRSRLRILDSQQVGSREVLLVGRAPHP